MSISTKSPIAVFSLFTGGPDQRLTKTVTLDEYGNLLKAAPQNAGSGQVETKRLPLSDLPAFLGGLEKNQCLIHGAAQEAKNGPMSVVVDALRGYVDGAISRTKDFFSFSAGPHLSMLDYDPGPGHEFTPDELIDVIDRSVFPGFAQAATVAVLSTSSAIYAGGELKSGADKPGFHLYIVAKDGRDIERFGKALFERLWLAGYGHGRLSKTGSFLVRGPIDGSVFSPERCDFVAGAVLEDGLEQRRPPPVYRPGGYLDTSKLRDLSDKERAEFERMVDAERRRLKPQQAPLRRRYAAEVAARTGEAKRAVTKRLEMADRGEIDADTVLSTKRGERMTLREMVRRDLDKAYVEDPTEDTETWARLYLHAEKGPHVLSFLHGWSRLYIQGLTEADLGWRVDCVDAADLGGASLKDSLEMLAKSETPASVARAIINRFARGVPSRYTADDLLEKIVTVAPDIEGAKEYLDWITGLHREEAIGLTAISAFAHQKHEYERINVWQIWPLGYELPLGVRILRAPHGVGKTLFVGGQFARDAKDWGETMVAACHRVSLTHELARRLEVDHYQNAPEIRSGLAVCVNSIIADGLERYCSRVENLFIDEFSQVLRHVADGSIRSSDRIKVYEALKRMICIAKRVIVCDADLGDREIDFLEMCRPNERFGVFEADAEDPGVSVTYQHSRHAIRSAYGAILADLDAGNKVIVATDGKKKDATLENLIKSELPDKKVLRVDADTDGGKAQQAFLKDPNARCVEYDIVIHSPSISSGVSIEVDHFDIGYGLFFGVIAPSDAIQMMRRSRKLRTWHLAFDVNNQNDGDDASILIDGMEQASNATATEFDRFRAGYAAWLNKGRNNFARNMLYLLEAGGYQLALQRDEGNDDAAAVDAAKDEAHAQRVQAILNAKDLEDGELEDLRRKQNRTFDENMTVLRAFIKNSLRLTDLTEADIEFFDEGRGLAKLRRFELAANLRTPLAGDDGPNLSLRRYDDVMAKAYHRILAPLGIDLKTGGGRFRAEEAGAMVDLVMRQPVLLSYLQIVPHSVNFGRPKDANKFVGRILAGMGLKTRYSGKKRVEGELVRRYEIDAESFASIRERALTRHAAAEQPPELPARNGSSARHFPRIDIQEIDEMPQAARKKIGAGHY